MVRMVWNRTTDITDFCGSISLSDNLDSVTMELKWNMPVNPQDRYLFNSLPKLDVGDKIDLIGETKTLFSGIIVERGIAGEMTAYDYGFYLKNNDVILQVKTDANTAISKLCEKAGIPLGVVPKMPTQIKKIYAEESCAEILEDILEQVTAEQGKNYFWRVKGGKLNIYEYPTKITYAYHKFETGNRLDITYALGSVGGSDSITELRNAVQVVSEDNETIKILATAEDAASIAKFGRMLDVVKQSGDEQNPQTVAENKLRENNTVKKTRNVSNMLGSEAVEAGVLLLFSSDQFEVSGVYLVKNVTHTFGAGHTMSMDIMKAEVV
ncbi:hypothetical protein [Anaerotignum sp.]|uniref:XkdQ/YqbQ family protein n=1 Tax=Anaerotignum sp. TaxID=2039241 RepID=UPI003A93E7A5